MPELLTLQDLANGHLDVKALGEAANGDENTIVTTRTGETYRSAKKAIKDMFENGGLPATPFVTKALMVASALVDDDYAMVTDDTANNGLYIKKAGAWVKSGYDPLTQYKSYADANPLFKPRLIGDNDNLNTYLTTGEYHKQKYTNATPEYGFPTGATRGVLKVSALGSLVVQFFTTFDTGVTYTRIYKNVTDGFNAWVQTSLNTPLKADKLYTQLEWQGRAATSVTYDRTTKTVSINGTIIAAYKVTGSSVRITDISLQLPADPDYTVCYIDLLAMNVDGVTSITSANKDLYVKLGEYKEAAYSPEVGKVPLFKFDATQNKAVASSGFPRVTVTGGEDSEEVANSYPKGFYENTTDTLIAYTQVKDDLYVGFNVLHQVNPDEVIYVDYWRIINAAFYTLSDGVMTATGEMALGSGESEFVIRHSASKDDATGGYHGDEKLISALFLADGLPIDVSTAHNLTACSEVEYIIKSNLHETAEGGVAIVGHPILAEHWKRTKFNNGGYTTNNKVFWKYNGRITHFYHGISCISKDVATTVMTGQSLTPQVMTNSGVEYFNEVGASEYIGWNNTTGLSVHANSKLIQNSVSDSIATLFISDRSTDSKYYCKDEPFQSVNGAVLETEFTCIFNSK